VPAGPERPARWGSLGGVGTPQAIYVRFEGRSVDTMEGTMAGAGFTQEQARSVAAMIGLDFEASEFDVEAFRRGMEVELEHGSHDPQTNVTNDDPATTGKIAWAHLKELPDYYERLEAMEEAEEETPPPPDLS
jgi:hypothetical protein